MKGKKVISIVLMSSLLMSNTSIVFGKNNLNVKTVNSTISAKQYSKITKGEAQNIGKKILMENFQLQLDDTCTSRAEYRKDYNEGSKSYVWGITFEKMNNGINLYASVVVDADSGQVMEAYVNDYDGDEGSKISSITESDALKVCDKFIKKMCPQEVKLVKLMKNNRYSSMQSTNYEFMYVRDVHGIPFDENTISIGVNGVTGKVNSYRCIWDSELKFPENKDVITLDKAKKIFDDNFNMELKYNLYIDKYAGQRENSVVKLIYNNYYENPYLVDGKKGEVLDPYLGQSKVLEKDLTQKEREEIYSKDKKLPKYPKELEKEDAEKLIISLLKEIYNDDYEIERIDYNDNGKGASKFYNSEIVWNAEAVKKGEKNTRVNIAIDGENGSIISLYENNYNEQQKEKYNVNMTYEEAYKKAINLILKNCPDKIREIETKQTYRENKMYDERNYSLRFNRKVNGVPYENNNIWISYNKETGKLTHFNCDWDNGLKFKDTKGCMDKKKAKEVFFKKYSPRLAYKKVPKDKDKTEIKLVYMLNSDELSYTNASMDAFTGKYINEFGEEIDENINEFKQKVKGNKYEKQLLILAYNGILQTKDFQLNKQINKMDLIRMLVNAKGYRPDMLEMAKDLKFDTAFSKGDANYKYLQLAVQYGIIENKEVKFDPNEKVKREDMAKCLIKVIGYDKLAKCSDIFKLQIKDINGVKKGDIGYIAIAKGLRLLELKDNKIRPKQNVTMIELCSAIYNVLNNLKTQ